MKTQIIQLEPHDDHISIRDKMNWSKTPRILLVFPRRKKLNLNAFDLKLLQRHARSLGAELGLVSRSWRIIRIAAELGIPVFDTNLNAQREAWHSPAAKTYQRKKSAKTLREQRKSLAQPEAAWRAHPAVRLAFFSLAALAVLVLAFAFIPQARVSIQPETRAQSLTIPVRASESVDQVYLSGSVPAQVRLVHLTGSDSLRATGRVEVPSRNARGTILFRNLTDDPIQIPAGTVIRSVEDSEIRFETLATIDVDGKLGAEAEVPVIALIYGERGNLAPDLLRAIEGELSLSITATNPAPTIGGENSFLSAPSQSDRDLLREKMMANFYKEAEAQILKELGNAAFIFSDSVMMLKIIEENYSPPLGEEGERVYLDMQVAVEVRYVEAENLRELAEAALNAALPPGYSPVAGSLSFEPRSEFDEGTTGMISWQMFISQDLKPKISPYQVIPLVQGRSLAAAMLNLEETFSLAEKPQIEISPAWWKLLPIAPFRIEVIVE